MEYFYRRESYRNEKRRGEVFKDFCLSYEYIEVTVENEERIPTGIHELDRVLGGGIVKGSLSLVGGDPGIGKSTLLLQVCRNLANSKRKVLYISGEESMHQIKMRAERIGTFEEEMLLYCETDLMRSRMRS